MTNFLRHSDSVDRRCSRCGLPLEDAASREHGYGPICRAKNNAIFAKQIPAEMAKASFLILSMKESDFHKEISDQFVNIKNLYLKKAEKVANEYDNSVSIILSGADFRPIIDWFDFALSYPCSMEIRNKIINFIESLGYQALAGILRGDVCMSPAKLYIENNFVFLQAKSNKSGFYALKQNIPNIVTPRFRGDKNPYMCNISNIHKFIDIVNRYWPFNEPTEDVLKALEATKANNMGSPMGTMEKPSATIINNSDWVKIIVPWHGTNEEMRNMINQFKSINYKERKYDPADRSWSFKMIHKNFIIDLIKNRYNLITI